jgi:hypothetical protein
MQDPLEKRLSKLPLQRAPADWKSTILKQAAHAVPGKPLPWNWMSLAAAWMLIGLLQWHTHEPGAPKAGEHPFPIFLPHLSALRSPDAYLEGLLADPSPIHLAPRQSRRAHKPTCTIA